VCAAERIIMTDQETIERFKFLRSQGWSFNRIAVELNISKPTLIKWGRQHQFEIANLRATETEGLIEKFFKPQHERLKNLSVLMQRIEQELEQRKLDTVPTARLLSLAAGLRAEIARESILRPFTEAIRNIPATEYVEEVMDWQV
jgi:IS30 family transposase